MARIPDKLIEQATAVAQTSAHALRTSDGGTSPRDACMPEFALGVVHEWIGAQITAADDAAWAAPHGVLLALAWSMLHADDGAQGSDWGSHTCDAQRDPHHDGRVTVWIGRRIWPSPRALLALDGSRALLARSIFVDPTSDRAGGGGGRTARSKQLWAVQQSLACEGAMTVIWDASHFDLTATRRTQLAAAREKQCAPVLALAVRPWHERRTVSSAATRWIVTAHAPDASIEHARADRAPHWRAELVRARGALGSRVGACAFVVRATWSWSGG